MIDKSIAPNKRPNVMVKDCHGKMCIPIIGIKILHPIKIKMIDNAGLRYANLLTMAASKKYNALKPKIAKMSLKVLLLKRV